MNKENAKQRIFHQAREFLAVFLWLAPFFAAFATYRIYLTGQSELLALGTALVNAPVLAKVILIGEIAKLGTLVAAPLDKKELLSIGLVFFFATIPFFAIREIRRVMGADNFRHLFLGGNRPERFSQPTVGVSGSRLSPGRV